MKRLTYLQAIRKHCLWCCGTQPKEVELCPDKKCPTHGYRFGKGNDSMKKTPLKAIRARCIDCSGFILSEVTGCEFDGKKETLCNLYIYRMGKNPILKGRRAGIKPSFLRSGAR